MGILSSIGNAIGNAYNAADRALGGYLPGGTTPQQVAADRASQSQTPTATISYSAPIGPERPSSSSSSSSSSSTTTYHPNINLPPPTQPTYSSGTRTDIAPAVPDSVKNVNLAASGGTTFTPADQSKVSIINQGSVGTATATPAQDVTAIQAPYDARNSMSFVDKAGSVIKSYTSLEFYQNIAQLATGTGQYQSPSPIKALGSFFSPLNVFGSTETKGDVRSADMPYSGTGIYNPQTGQYEVPSQYKGKTGYERLQEQAILNPDILLPSGAIVSKTSTEVIGELQPQFESRAGAIASGYQAQINEGRLTVEQATPLYQADISALQSQFQTQAQGMFEQRIGSRIQQSQYFKQEFASLSNPLYPQISTIATIGTLVGTGFAGGSSVAAFRSASRAANIAVSIEGQSNIYGGIANKNVLQVGLGFAAFGLGTYGALKSAANEVTIARIEGVTSQRPRIEYGYRFDSASKEAALRENQYMDIAQYRQMTGSAQAVTRETIFSEFSPQLNRFKITSGTSETLVQTTDYWTGRTLFVGSYRTFQGGGIALPEGAMGMQGELGTSISLEGFKSSRSFITTTQQYSYKYFSGASPVIRFGGPIVTEQLGGESQLREGFIRSRSGTLIQEPVKVFELQGGAGKAFERQPGIYSADTFTLLKYRGASSPDIYFNPMPSSGLRGNVDLPGSSISPIQAQTSFNIPGSSVAGLGASETFKFANQFIFKSADTFAGPVSGVSFGSFQVRESSTKESQIIAPALSTRGLQEAYEGQITDVFPGAAQGGSQMPGLSSINAQIPAFPNVQAPIAPQEFAMPLLSSPGGKFNPFGGIDIPFSLPNLRGFDPGELGLGPIPSGKQRKKYTPDFESLVFGIRGRAPRGGAAPSPFVARPIPSGFSLAFSEGESFEKIIKSSRFRMFGRKR
jgi:hypothetical protein